MMRTETLENGTVETWTPREVYDALEAEKIVLIDVRTPAEYAFEHVEGSFLSPMAFTNPKNFPTQDGKQIVLHCGSGIRSGRVADICLGAGFGKIAHMDGGFSAWKAEKLPYISTDMATGGPKRVV